MPTVYNYAYSGANGVSYTGFVVGSGSATGPYNYQTGQTYQMNGGTYTIGAAATQPATAAPGSMYINTYNANGNTYDVYAYNPGTGQYYDMKTNGFSPYTGSYAPAGATTPVDVRMGTFGLGSEYGYIKTTDGNYHSFGGGGLGYAQITPSTLGVQGYDYKFTYPDGSYYTGTVYDDGTYKYAAGYTRPVTDANNTQLGSYAITGPHAGATPAGYMAGYVTSTTYHDGKTGTDYVPWQQTAGTPLVGKPDGYGGLGSETDYIKTAGGWQQYGYGGHYEGSTSTPVATVPPPIS